MAYTDDISEKVADILLDQTAKATNFGLDTGKKLVVGAGVLGKAGYKALTGSEIEDAEKLKKLDAEMERLLNTKGEIKPGQMQKFATHAGLGYFSITVSMNDAAEYEDLIRKSDVLYAKMNVKDDNAKMFTFLNRDAETIENVTTVMNANRKLVSEVRPDLYFNNLAADDVQMIDGLDKEELELFRHYAREEKLLFTSFLRQDKYCVIYNKNDIQKARKAMLHVGWDLTGQDGALSRKQVEYHIRGRQAVQIAAEEAERELYIVNKRNPEQYMHITSEDLETYKSGKLVSKASRSNPDFFTRCFAAFNSFESAALLRPDQFHANMTREELDDMPSCGLHIDDYDEMIQTDKLNNLINLVAMKSGMDNEHNATWGLWDTSVSYSEFSGYEFIMDTEEREAREAEFDHFRDAAFYSQRKHMTQDIHLDEKNLDFLIAKAEEKRKSYEAGAREHTAPQQEKSSNGPLPGL